MTEVAEQTPQAIEKVSRQLPRGFPAAVSDPIFSGILARVKKCL
ncbi:hypothetical protein WDW37_17845 [Bdellovibrionota bacterium FG-1]